MTNRNRQRRRWRPTVSHRVTDGRLQRRVLLLLAADVVEGEEDVVVVRQGRRELDLDLIVEVWRSVEIDFFAFVCFAVINFAVFEQKAEAQVLIVTPTPA